MEKTNEGTMASIMLKPSEAARIAGVSVRTITRMCEAGQLKAAHFGRAWRINKAEFMAMLGMEA